MKNASVSLPLFNSRKGHPSTSELIFKILSVRHPLTISELRNELAKRHRLKITYQAVRKSLASLGKAGAVEHTSQGFELSTGWLLSARSVIDDTLRNYCYAKGESFDPSLRSQTFSGHSLYEVDTLWGEIVVNVCASQSKSDHKRFISINHYPWWIPMNVGHEVEFCRRLQELGFDVLYLFSSKCPSTAWARQFYGSFDVAVTINPKVKISRAHYYNVIGETVIEVELSAAHERKIASLFGGRRRPERIAAKELVALSHQRGEIQITVQQNKTFAEGLLRTAGLLR